MSDDLLPFRILESRAQRAELSSTIRQLQRSGLDDAAPCLLITRRRAELEDLTRRRANQRPHGGSCLAHEPLEWYDDKSDHPAWIKALANVRPQATLEATAINMCKRSSSPSISTRKRR